MRAKRELQYDRFAEVARSAAKIAAPLLSAAERGRAPHPKVPVLLAEGARPEDRTAGTLKAARAIFHPYLIHLIATISTETFVSLGSLSTNLLIDLGQKDQKNAEGGYQLL